MNQITQNNSFFIFLNKPKGLSSQQYLTLFKKKFGFKKIGHHGTLDPFATGLLLVGVNEATKFFQYIDDSFKSYRATLRLGKATDTLDNTGTITEEKPVPLLELSDIQSIAGQFVGVRNHTPPMYSAVKIGGKKLYELARQGQDVERASRQIEIKQLTVVEWSPPHLVFDMTVSRGTYIRVLADELARALGTAGHLVELVRTELCGYHLKDASTLECGEEIESKKIPIENILSQYARVEIDQNSMREILFGKKIILQNDASSSEQRTILLFSQGLFLGVASQTGDIVQPLRLMSPQT